MEHEGIDLNPKHSNPRETNGRFRVKTNKTLKYDRGMFLKFREKESITVIEPETQNSDRYNSRKLDLGVGISLNAQKNWELLRSSQDDTDVEYGRVVDLDFDMRIAKTAQREELYRRIYGTTSENNTNNTSDDNNEPEFVSGTNRKGHFVKAKRKPGKKGVKRYKNNKNDSNDSGDNNSKENMSKGRSTGSDSNSDSDDEPANPNAKIILIQRHNPKTNMHLEQYKSSWSHQCTCPQCTGVIDSKQRRIQTHRDLEALDLSVL